MGDFLGGGLVFAVAAALWIMYLIPTWKRRRHFDATEMNAVRMQQTIRALAETADVPEEVEVEASARAVIEQKRILREAEAAAMAEVREATAKAVGFDMKAYHAKRRARIARMISASVLLVTLIGTVVSGVMLFTAGAWQPLALWAIAFAAALFIQEAVVSATATTRAAPVRQAQDTIDFAPSGALIQRSWSPNALPKPLHLSEGSLAAAVVASQIEAEKMRLASADSALVERLNVNSEAIANFKKAQAAKVAAQAAPSSQVSARLAAMGVVDAGVTASGESAGLNLDEVLRRRRAN